MFIRIPEEFIVPIVFKDSLKYEGAKLLFLEEEEETLKKDYYWKDIDEYYFQENLNKEYRPEVMKKAEIYRKVDLSYYKEMT